MEKEKEFLQAIVESDFEKVRKILEEGLDPDFETTSKMTPLYYAIKYSCSKVLELLLNYGIDPYLISEDNHTSLLLAIKSEVEQAVYRCDIHGELLEPSTAKVELLLKSGVKPYDLKERGDLVEYARVYGHYEAAQLLLEYGAIDPEKSQLKHDLYCCQCKVLLSKMINSQYRPCIEEIKEFGSFFIPKTGWFCSQPCGDKYETERNVWFYRNKDGLIDY